ncbi:LCP family protein [Ruminococcus sp.]|uniref:LCP family protein n=1 Tax=Ruminococcus sp. TaxID=41978 RepID=UPI0025E23BF4|nr:LCP family protein [Ruminococcus sp.]
MPHRYNGRDENNIPNTDNEETMLISGVPDEYEQERRELPPLKRVNRRAYQPNKQQNQEYTYTHNEKNVYSESQLPPQFPHSSAPPPPMHQNTKEGDFYDYNDQPPEKYSEMKSSVSPADPIPFAPPPSHQKQPNRKKIKPVQEIPIEQPKSKKKRHHKSLLKRIIGRVFKIVLVLFLLMFGVYSCTSVSLIKKVQQVPSEGRNHSADDVGRGHVRSILVIGTDGRTAEERGRSDSMILFSLNSKTNEIIMTSFMRDSYVEIPNNGWDKLNAAYAYGGPDLLMDTIEYNFDVRIDDYVSVDFASFVSVVDAVGGVDIEVSNAEAEQINIILISEVNLLMGDDMYSDLLSGGGKLHLNGKQALSYSRIRNVGNNDFERTERQRRVMSLIFAKIKSFKPSVFKNLASDVIPDVSTNMTEFEMYLLSLRVPFAARYKTKQIQIPAEGTYYGADVDVGNVLQVDRNANIDIIDKEVFSKG